MKKFILIGLFLILILIFGSIRHLTSLESQEEIKLEFSSGPCNTSIDPYDQSNLGIKEVKWLDETILEIKAYVSINCMEEIEDGDYRIEGNKIILTYKSPRCKEICAECLCAHELTYKFLNLKRRNYQFELERIE